MDTRSLLFDYVERLRVLVSPETWQQALLDLSKNDYLALLFLYRCGEARMGELAGYLNAPLNTATGVIARLQHQGYVERHNSPDDKRVVNIRLSKRGEELTRDSLDRLIALLGRVLEDLSADELRLLLGVIDKIAQILAEDGRPAPAQPTLRRIPID